MTGIRERIGNHVDAKVNRKVYAANRFFPDGYAVWDWQTRGFARDGFTGQQVFETLEEAEEVAGEQQLVVKLERPTGSVESEARIHDPRY